MKKLPALLFVVMMTLLVCSCTMPSTVVKTVDDRPSVAIVGAPPEALLFIDGINMGQAVQYNAEPNVLTLEPGTHAVRVVAGDQVLYDQKVFVESSLKTIRLR